mmetsp:Transcript_2094/g.5875  ORF Transcript_2094/g.5875 Transcript_2094/m.5875 type:complete len:256 (-) Transcript_2094:508-1275(-)
MTVSAPFVMHQMSLLCLTITELRLRSELKGNSKSCTKVRCLSPGPCTTSSDEEPAYLRLRPLNTIPTLAAAYTSATSSGDAPEYCSVGPRQSAAGASPVLAGSAAGLGFTRCFTTLWQTARQVKKSTTLVKVCSSAPGPRLTISAASSMSTPALASLPMPVSFFCIWVRGDPSTRPVSITRLTLSSPSAESPRNSPMLRPLMSHCAKTISLRVRVPVLSENMKLICPISSIRSAVRGRAPSPVSGSTICLSAARR